MESGTQETDGAAMTTREQLPQRRRAESFEVEFGQYAPTYLVTLGYYADGRLGEVFISGGKSGELVESIARDGAIVLSFALQHGASLEAIGRALTRDGQGAPSSVVGAVVDAMTGGSSAPAA